MRNDALRVVSMLAASSNNAFTRTQAASEGLDPRRIRRLIDTGVLHEPWHGALVALPPDGRATWTQLLTAATLKGSVASHRASARLNALDGLETCPVIETSSLVRRTVLRGVVQHRVAALPGCDIVEVDGVPCTNIARTLADLGSVCHQAVVERAFDDAVRRGANPRWLRSTAERLRRPGQAGPSVLLRLLDLFDERGTVRGSWFERLIEMCLAHPELASLEIQHTLRDADGRHVATFDLAIPDALLGIEGHSKRHHFGASGEASDEHRDNAAGRLGWDVMYLGYGDVRSPSTVLQEVLARVRVRRAQLSR